MTIKLSKSFFNHNNHIQSKPISPIKKLQPKILQASFLRIRITDLEVLGISKQQFNNNVMQTQKRNSQKVQSPQNRYSIFHNPLFDQKETLTFQKVPFHISIDQQSSYQYVIDHTNNHIQQRRSIPKAEDGKSERSNSSRKKIFSEKKKDQVRQIGGVSPIELLKGKEQYSLERQARKHKIFGAYPINNYNDELQSKPKTINKRFSLTNETETSPFALVQRYSQPVAYFQTKVQNKAAQLIVNKKINVREEPLNPNEFAKLMSNVRQSQRLKYEKPAPKQEIRVVRTIINHVPIQPQMFLR